MPCGGLDSVIVGTLANSALGLVTQGFLGHIIRDSWCHGHFRCLAPHAMAIEKPRMGTLCRIPIQSQQSPEEGRTDVSLGGEKPSAREGRQCFRRWQVSIEGRCMVPFLILAETRGAMRTRLWRSSCIMHEVEKGGDGRGRNKLYIFKLKAPFIQSSSI